MGNVTQKYHGGFKFDLSGDLEAVGGGIFTDNYLQITSGAAGKIRLKRNLDLSESNYIKGSNSDNSDGWLIGHGTANNDLLIINYKNSPVRFYQNGQERAQFATTNGNFLLHTAVDNGVGKLQVNGNATINGNLGVGLSAANARGRLHLHYGSDTSNYLHITNSASGSSADDGFSIGLVQTTLDGSVWLRENANLIFGQNNTERLRIATNGNVGIGVSTNIFGNITLPNNGILAFHDTGGDSRNVLQFSTSNDIIYGGAGSGTNNHIFKQGGSELIRIATSGNLLVGTSTDGSNKLEVNGNTNSTSYSVGGTAGASGTATSSNTLTIVNGIITNIA